jgi:hypothetical protein
MTQEQEKFIVILIFRSIKATNQITETTTLARICAVVFLGGKCFSSHLNVALKNPRALWMYRK